MKFYCRECRRKKTPRSRTDFNIEELWTHYHADKMGSLTRCVWCVCDSCLLELQREAPKDERIKCLVALKDGTGDCNGVMTLEKRVVVDDQVERWLYKPFGTNTPTMVCVLFAVCLIVCIVVDFLHQSHSTQNPPKVEYTRADPEVYKKAKGNRKTVVVQVCVIGIGQYSESNQEQRFGSCALPPPPLALSFLLGCPCTPPLNF